MLFYLIFTVGLFLIRRTGILLIPAALLGVVAAGEAVMPLSAIAEPMTLAQYWTRPILLLFPVGALPRLNVQNVSPVLFVATALVGIQRLRLGYGSSGRNAHPAHVSRDVAYIPPG